MRIWIDADACPRDTKDLVFRASERLDLPVCLVANQDMYIPRSPLLSLVRVADDFNAADDYIAEHLDAEDVVITADIPLADRVVKKGAAAIDPRGEEFTEENIGERLSVRDFMDQMRSAGLVQGGPPPLDKMHRHRFAAALDRVLTRRLKDR